MGGAIAWGFIGGSSLLLGGLLALRRPIRLHPLGLVMDFGSGVLISAVAYELVEDYRHGRRREVEVVGHGGDWPPSLGPKPTQRASSDGRRLLILRGTKSRVPSHEGTPTPVGLPLASP